MKTVVSKDGTRIAYDVVGKGQLVVLVGGAFSQRKYQGFVQLAELLAPHFTVVNYDRRGRGDSTDTQPYAVEREIEDLQAIITAEGGPAFVFGMSSGAMLALRAAKQGVPITKLALYEPPMKVNGDGQPADFAPHLQQLVAAGKRDEAVKFFMTKGMGAPGIAIFVMRLMGMWRGFTDLAHTLVYDQAVMNGFMEGKPLTAEDWVAVKAPTLVMSGSKSPADMRHAAASLAKTLPNATLQTMQGLSHMKVTWPAIAPVLETFFKG